MFSCVCVFDAQYAYLHNFSMKYDIPAILRALVQRIGTQALLAERLGGGISQPQISRWLKGAAPEVGNYQRIIDLAKNQEVISDFQSEDVAASLPDPIRRKTVQLKGYVGAGSEAHFYALADEDYEPVDAPPGATDQTIAVEIKGSSMGKALESWLVFYDDVRAPVSTDQLNELCVVGLADDRILIKRIERGPRGTYRLISNNPDEPPIDNAQIEWAALVTSMRRRR